MSKNLHRYLKKHGGYKHPRELKKLKREYRRQYQNAWQRKQRSIGKHEIRFFVDPKDYSEVTSYCQGRGTRPTELARELLLTQVNSQGFMPQKKKLLQVACELGLAINQLSREDKSDGVRDRLLSAESKLLRLLNT